MNVLGLLFVCKYLEDDLDDSEISEHGYKIAVPAQMFEDMQRSNHVFSHIFAHS